MDGSKLLYSLDSLWFFSNVFTSSTLEEKVDDDAHVEFIPEKEETAEEINQIEEIKQNDETPDGKISIRCEKCGEFAAEIESLKVVVEELEEKKKIRRRGRRTARRRRSNRRSFSSERRQIFGELDLGFYGQMESHPPHSPPLFHHHESPWLLDDFETTFEFENIGAQHYVNIKKMPPLNDGLAMKKHLKSWAYAVACTVR